jgi:signal transduction histidine kinase/phage shock protein PspC (stress-responsive transcriptional regulator)
MATAAPPDQRLRRSSGDRVLSGVAGGLGERLGIDPVVIRLAFAVLSLAGGAGVVLYLSLFLVMGWPDPNADPVPTPRMSARQAIAVTLVVAGLLVISRRAGLWFGDQIVWPAALAVAGSAVLWTRGDGAHRARWLRRLPHAEALDGSRLRALAGVGLILLGAWALLSNNLTLFANAPLAVVAVLAGLAVVAGPWVWRLVRQVALERRERIRQEERAEMAAHLHDSVLQTLALIQRTDDPGQMVALARGQERALRTWLYGKMRPGGAGSLSAALDDVAAEVERTHRTRIEVVMVGDCPVDDGVRALVEACREAMVNAARHSGARGVSAYVEVEDDAVTAFVRDQGVGFARSSVPADRHGIAESIEGRMERNGGVALIESEPGYGTEVRLRIPRARA